MNFKNIFTKNRKKKKIKKIFEILEECSFELSLVRETLKLLIKYKYFDKNIAETLNQQLLSINKALHSICDIEKELLSDKY